MSASRKLASRARIVLLATTALVIPCAAQAATITWTGTASTAWETSGNWTPSGTPTTTSGVVINSTTNSTVQLNSNVSLTGTGGSLSVGCGFGCVATDTLNINSGDTLTMAAKPVTLSGGAITGLGTLSATGTISGYGTISSKITGTSFSANTTVGGTAFGGFSPFVNGTPGPAITLIGQNNLTSDTFTVSNRGNFIFQGVTLTTPTLGGVSNNLYATAQGGGNTPYGLFAFTGAASTIVGNINNSNYDELTVNGTTLHLNGVTMTNNWGASAPAAFVVNSGGTLDNTVGNSNLLSNTVLLGGGSLTNSGGGVFDVGHITGTGTVSGPMVVTGGVTANGGVLTVDGTSGGGITAASAGWGTSGSGSTLDLKGTINFAPSGSYPAAPALNPSGGTVQLDGVTINTSSSNLYSLYTGSGQFTAATGVNTINGSLLPNSSNGSVANYTIDTGASLIVNTTNSGNPAISANNFTMQNGSMLQIEGVNKSISLTGNFSYQQTDTVHAWTTASGLGPDLIMGTTSGSTNLEVGGINKGNVPSGFTDNFAFSSLTIRANTTVDLVDQYANATSSGWTSGVEALYLDGLFGTSKTVAAILNLDGLFAYLEGYGVLTNGIYTDSNGDLVAIFGENASLLTPLPGTLPLFASGLGALGLLGWRRKRKNAAIAA